MGFKAGHANEFDVNGGITTVFAAQAGSDAALSVQNTNDAVTTFEADAFDM